MLIFQLSFDQTDLNERNKNRIGEPNEELSMRIEGLGVGLRIEIGMEEATLVPSG